MRDYYEQLWERLPEDLATPEWAIRSRWLQAHLRARERVLDLGCGDGRFTELIAQAGAEVVGVEVAEAALARARRRAPTLDFRLAPIDGALPLPDNDVQLVWASEVIEHVSDTAVWLSEVRRVLAPGGRLLITTPSHGRLRVALGGLERFSPPLGDHLHLYSRRALAGLLRDFDFEAVSVRTAGGPPLLRRVLLAAANRP